MNTRHIDWSQLWYPGPRRAFTADEMARAGHDEPGPTLLAIVGINVALAAFVVLQAVPQAQVARVSALLIALVVMGHVIGRWLWRRPWRGSLLKATGLVMLASALLTSGLRWRMPAGEERQLVGLVLGLWMGAMLIMLWFLVVWRAQQIEARLAAQVEREHAIEMARRLSAAQLQPHFLFNALASVQHWVETKDDRAAPLLASLTGYLRATLPLFNLPSLPAAEELVAVRRYLEVMQARLGARLAWRIDVDPAAGQALLPPGLLLTLVENAVGHGIEPQLGGGEVLISGSQAAGEVLFEVRDSGPGPAADMTDGVGLANARERLTLAGGRLTLQPAPGGGCIALIRLPSAPTA